MKHKQYCALVRKLPHALLGLMFSQLALAQTAIPGNLEAESYSYMSGVQLEATSDAGGGQNVGWIDTGDWMNYSVNVASSGWYTVQYRVASTGSNGKIVLSQNSKDISAISSIPSTGGWQNWTTINSRVYLNAGTQNLVVYAIAGGFNVNWVKFTSETTPQPNLLPAIKQNGPYWVNATNGNRVNLRGVNLGNWLIQEFWMMDGIISTNAGGVGDQCTLEATLSQRFGNAEKERLMKVFRDSFITTRDLDLIKSMGMNVIRVPFLYSVIENEYAPYTVRADAWQYLDWVVTEAEKRGIYTILDLHGAVGGQAKGGEQHDGCVGDAQMWTNAAYWDRTKWLWETIAQHYRGRNAVAAYDLLNEPWAVDAATLAARSYELFNAVRTKDTDHVIILPGHDSGVDAYGTPSSKGATNAGTGMHFYPGLWGWNDGAAWGAGQANMYASYLDCDTSINWQTCEWRDKLNTIQTPFLVGEFQPWTMMSSYSGQMTRKAFDTYNMHGWAATAWAYKTTTPGGSNGDTTGWGWGMVTNSSSGGTMSNLNVSTASSAQIETWFRQFATQPLVRNENIAYWMNWKPTVGNRIEAEMYANQKGVRSETTTDQDGGFNAGYLDDNDWMSYPINIPTTGWYTLQARLSSPYTGGQMVLTKNGTDVGVVTVPNTGGWQNWQTVTTSVYLTAGQQDLTVLVRKGGWNINWWQLNAQ